MVVWRQALERLRRRRRPPPPPAVAGPPPSRVVVQCNLIEVSGQPPRAYLSSSNFGNAAEHVEIVLRTPQGRWAQCWKRIDRVDNFRVKTLPPEHPRHKDERILDLESRDQAERLVQSLRRAREDLIRERTERGLDIAE